MTQSAKPILIIGTQRSGSNLLRIMLNQLKEIEAPHPPHILINFFPLLHLYGNLEDDTRFATLVDDVCNYTEANPVNWELNFNRDEVYTRCKTRTLVQVFKVLYEIKAEVKNAECWCCKSMANMYYIPEIEKEFKPFYIHLVRDGRDVAASFKRAVVGEKHIYFIAEQWRKDQELAAGAVQDLGSSRAATLYYEQFIVEPEKTLSPILQRLGLKWNDKMMYFYTSEEAHKTAAAGEMWKNVEHRLDPNNKMHYREKLSADDISIFEKVAGKTLVQFGYRTDNAFNDSSFTGEEIESFKVENEKLKKQARSLFIKDVHLRIPQEKILDGIKARFSK